MRVIAGKAKGRKLRPVPGDIARLITDRVKGYDPDHPRGLKKVTRTS